MISRADIENEAAFIQRLINATNPTGGKHTPTPWHAADDVGTRVETGIKLAGDGFPIHGEGYEVLALFKCQEDRDLALYFANIHAGVIAMLRGFAGSFEFIARTAPDAGGRQLAQSSAENARIYADLLSRLGKVEPEPASNGA